MQSSNKVFVVLSKDGDVVSVTANPEYGFVRLSQEAVVFNGKFADIKTRRCIMVAKTTVLDRMFPNAMAELSGRIVIRETITPLNPANLQQGLKVAGSTGIVCIAESGDNIYRDTFYTEDAAVVDVFVPHVNQEAIKAAQAKLNKANSAGIKNAGKKPVISA